LNILQGLNSLDSLIGVQENQLDNANGLMIKYLNQEMSKSLDFALKSVENLEASPYLEVNFSQQEPAVGSRDISHVTPAIPMNQDPQNVLSSTQACTASSSTTVTQPPKPKLNIIDPQKTNNLFK
jgi:hypothetical protein